MIDSYQAPPLVFIPEDLPFPGDFQNFKPWEHASRDYRDSDNTESGVFHVVTGPDLVFKQIPRRR